MELINLFTKTGKVKIDKKRKYIFNFYSLDLCLNNRKFVKFEIDRHRPQIGGCLGAFASTFPVAFLEPHLNNHNPYCIHGKLQESSLEAQDVMSKLESSLPTLEAILVQVEQFVTSEKSYTDAPFIIDVMLPMLCSYLPFWWNQGPDNLDPVGG